MSYLETSCGTRKVGAMGYNGLVYGSAVRAKAGNVPTGMVVKKDKIYGDLFILQGNKFTIR